MHSSYVGDRTQETGSCHPHEHGTWTSDEHLQTTHHGWQGCEESDVHIHKVQDGTETGPNGQEIGEDASGTIDQTVMGGHLHLSRESFAIHDGEGTLHSEGLFTAVDVHGKMHYDETSGQVVVDAASDSFMLSANANGAIAAVTKVAFHTLVSKGYLELQDVGSLGRWAVFVLLVVLWALDMVPYLL